LGGHERWLNYLAEKLQAGGKFDDYTNDQTLIKETTAAGLKDMAHKYLLNGNFIKLILMPEKQQ